MKEFCELCHEHHERNVACFVDNEPLPEMASAAESCAFCGKNDAIIPCLACDASTKHDKQGFAEAHICEECKKQYD